MQPDNHVTLRKVRDFGDVLNVTFVFFKQNFQTLCKSLALFALPIGAVLVVGSMLIMGTAFSIVPGAVDWRRLAAAMALLLPLSYLMTTMMLLVIFGSLKLYDERGGEPVGVADLWSICRAYFWRYVRMLLALFVILAGSMLVAIIPCLGIFVWFAGMVYAAPSLLLAFVVRMNEDLGTIDAIKRAWKLTDAARGQSIGIIFISFLIAFILSLVFSIPRYIASAAFGVTTVSGGTSPVAQSLLVILGLLGTVCSLVIMVIPYLAMGIQYYNLVEMTDRAGLMERVAAMEASGAEPDESSRYGVA